jgi:hypothetical protein
MSVINQNLLLTPEGYQIGRSVRLRRSASAYLNRTFGTPTNANIWTLSGWTKRGLLGTQISLFGASVSSYTSVSFLAGDTLRINLGNGTNGSLVTTQVFRDPSAFYHIAIAYDSTQATASNRIKLYINGNPVTSFSTANYPAQNVSAEWNYSGAVGTIGTAATEYFDGYLTEVNFIDGQALTPSSFGETDAVTGVWKPKKYAGTYGTNGFYLNFSDNSAATAAAIGKDSSGNGNNWTPNNISVTAGVTYDSMIDVPTMWADGGNGRGNYAVLSPLDKVGGTLTNANLSSSSTLANNGVRSTIAVSSGKWYWEWLLQDTADNHHGVWSVAEAMGSNYVGQTAGSWGMHEANGNKRNNGSYTTYGSGFSNGDVGMLALDMDNGKIWWGKNGTWFASGDPAAGTNAAFANLSGYTIAAAHLQQRACSYNFGQRPFAYTPPTGFKALNTQNLPDATIKNGNQYFDASLYTGTGSAQSIVNSGAMQPDLVWIKNRNNADFHRLTDSVRGASLSLRSDATTAEQTTNSITSFNTNGFSVGTENTSSYTYVGWQWKKGATQGFDIVTYSGNGQSGRALPHSLGVAPRMVVIKSRTSTTEPWIVGHNSISWSNYLALNTTAASSAWSGAFNNTAPTSTDLILGSGGATNSSGQNYVAYLFAEVAGFSKFGSYTGNGSADGTFAYTGFRPKFVMVKRSNSTGNWDIFDSQRIQYNMTTSVVSANTSAAEVNASNYGIDITSNGFKLRTSDATINASGGTYIFMAFAENPFKNSLAR